MRRKRGSQSDDIKNTEDDMAWKYRVYIEAKEGEE